MKDAMEQMLAEGVPGSGAAMDREERVSRARLISRLFRAYGNADAPRAEVYVDATAEIPLHWLAIAVHAVLRARVYSSLPAIGELWDAARVAAGMDRQQYHAGRYLPPPRHWPPPGKRHGAERGALESIGAGGERVAIAARAGGDD